MTIKHSATSIVKKYITLAKHLGAHPTRADLQQIGISRDTIRHYFTNLLSLKKMTREFDPSAFSNVIDDEFFSKQRRKALSADLKAYQRFVITTAIGGAPVDKRFYKTLKQYCAKRDAKLLVLYAADTGSGGDHAIDPILLDEHLITQDVALNSNIFISTIKLSAKHIDPITGLDRIGQRDGTFIYASPKQRLKSIPASNTKPPHILMTTGAITKPSYSSKTYMNSRTAYLATHDHVMGAIVVEIVDDKFYHFRQLQADKKGRVVDLGRIYQSQSKLSSAMRPEALVLGDSHVLENDPTAEKAWEEAFMATGCQDVVLHDVFSGVSINHHEHDKRIVRAQLAGQHRLSLEDEFKAMAQYLNKWTNKARKVYIVASNHHDFLMRYLDEGWYAEDAQNHKMGALLAAAAIDGHDPLQYAMEKLIGLNHPEKIVWMNRDTDLKVAGVMLSAHGDKGANGAKGSLRALEAAYGNSISGHAHSVEILRGAWQVGTSSYLKLRYNSGSSSWLHGSCLLYPNGARQLIISINGHWRLKD